MLLSSLVVIRNKIVRQANENNRVTFSNIEEKIFDDFFKKYKKNDFINPYNLIGPNLFSEEIVKKIFKFMVKEKYLKPVYKVCCPLCYTFNNEIYEELDEIYESFLCPKCEFEFENQDIFNSLIALYKVIKE